jgi:hypothetical protein
MSDVGNHRRNWLAPFLVAVLMFLPVLYVGSYAAMVRPTKFSNPYGVGATAALYRFGGQGVRNFYWPLEQVDRFLFPGRWPTYEVIIY